MLPPYVLVAIDNWLIILKYNDKVKRIISQFKYKGNPILHKIPYEYRNTYHNLEYFQIYSSTMYEWAHRLTTMSLGVFSTSGMRRTKKPQYITQLTPKIPRKYHIRVAQLLLRQHINQKIPYLTS